MHLQTLIENASDATLAKEIIDSFKEIERNYTLKSWKTSELDAGHFVEAVRRFVENKLFGNYTPIGRNLPSFTDRELNRYLNAMGDDAYRIHIPRALWMIYAIRNKRGVGHLSQIKANQVDANQILNTAKWILAELVRLNSTIPIEQTESLVDEIIERNIEGVWSSGNIKRVLVDGLSIKAQILILLYNYESLTDEELYKIIENGNQAYLKKTLRDLHKKRFIEYKDSGECILSPKGSLEAEKILLSN